MYLLFKTSWNINTKPHTKAIFQPLFDADYIYISTATRIFVQMYYSSSIVILSPQIVLLEACISKTKRLRHMVIWTFLISDTRTIADPYVAYPFNDITRIYRNNIYTYSRYCMHISG